MTMSPTIREVIEELKTKNCYELIPNLTSHDNLGFWEGFWFLANKILPIEEAYQKRIEELEKEVELQQTYFL